MALRCRKCGRSFNNAYNCRRHERAAKCQLRYGGRGQVPCDFCDRKFANKFSLQRHANLMHPDRRRLAFVCGLCDQRFVDKEELLRHRIAAHMHHHNFDLVESAHNKKCQLLRAFYPAHVMTMDESLVYGYEKLCRLVESLAVELRYFKLNCTTNIEMYRLDEFGQVEEMAVFPFRAYGMRVTRGVDFKEDLRKLCGDFERNVDEFLYRGSGWVVNKPMYLDAEVVACQPMSGRAARVCAILHEGRWIRRCGLRPTDVIGGAASDCFYLAVASFFCGVTASREDLDAFIAARMRKLPPPPKSRECMGVHVKDVSRFEELNATQLDVAVNIIYKDEDGCYLPVCASKRLTAANVVVLLLFHVLAHEEEGEEEKGEGGRIVKVLHYALLREPERLLGRRTCEPATGAVTTSRSLHICWNCFNSFTTKNAYQSHVAYCHQNNCQRIILPEKGEVKSFVSDERSRAKSFLSAWMLFFDFEALQVPATAPCSCPPRVLENTRRQQEEEEAWEKLTVDEKIDACLQDEMDEGERTANWESAVFDAVLAGRKPPLEPKKSKGRRMRVCKHKTKTLKQQPPFSYSYLLLDREGKVHESKTYVGEDAADNFVLSVLNLADKYLPSLSPGVPMEQLTVEERKAAASRTRCYLCDQVMEWGDRVFDHCHLTGRLLGVAHDACNLARREQVRLTCFSHNFSGYDSHFLVRSFRHHYPRRIQNIFGIPQNTQRFKAININNRIQFVDSFQFLSDSLASLAGMLESSHSVFPVMDQLVQDPVSKKLLLRKGVYPYAFATSIQALREATVLPPRKHFTSDITGETCTEQDYQHAEVVWKHFGCSTMEEYTNLYIKTDTYLLADIMLDFRNRIWQAFELDICQYLSLPHLAMDAMLKQTGVEIELLSDHLMCELFRKSIRGGHSFVNRRHAVRTNNKTLLYLDATNLYGCAMTHSLPLRDFRWMTEEELSSFDAARDVSEDEGPGFVLEVDLEYPEELHLRHNSFPLAPETVEIGQGDLSPYSLDCLATIHNTGRYKAKKLTAHFKPRRNYLVHGLNLKLYLELGMKLVRVHRGVTFYQAPYIRNFIETCTRKRMTAVTPVEQTMWKLICNSIYGKLIESYEKRMDAKFNMSEEEVMRNATSPLFKGVMVCGEDLSLSFMKKKSLSLKQAWPVGFSILEISKYIMQKMYYKEVLPVLGFSNVATVMSDTDSFLLETTWPNETELMRTLRHVLDTANLPSDHELYSRERNKVPGFLKNEFPNASITEVVALRSKTYAIETDGGDTQTKAKGVTGPARRKQLPLAAFRKCLERMQTVQVKQRQLRSVKHINTLIESCKVACSSFDDKRYLLCARHSVPYGSYVIERDQGKPCRFCENPDMLY